MKSFWKFAFTNRQILDFFFKSKKRFHIKNYDIVINLIKNEGRIMLGFLGISVWMDNGSKNLDSFIVKKNKLGFNFQDFLNTKIEGSSIHRRKKKKRKDVRVILLILGEIVYIFTGHEKIVELLKIYIILIFYIIF